jgi:hypothetical protein
VKRGPLFEKHVVEYLRSEGFDKAERRVMGGSNDRGDIAGIPNVCLEVKNTGVMQMGAAVAEAEKEASNAGARWWSVVFKRRQKGVERAYVVIDLEQWSRVLRILDAHGWLA